MAQKIEGCARHISVHAAGVVISPTPLTDYVPLQYDTKGDNKIITQYDMNDVGEDGGGDVAVSVAGAAALVGGDGPPPATAAVPPAGGGREEGGRARRGEAGPRPGVPRCSACTRSWSSPT